MLTILVDLLVDLLAKLGPTTHEIVCLLAGLRIGLPG
jgi:hypothetical protein